MVGERRGGSRSNVVWFFLRFGRQRGFGKRAIGHVAFHSRLRLYFYVAFQFGPVPRISIWRRG